MLVDQTWGSVFVCNTLISQFTVLIKNLIFLSKEPLKQDFFIKFQPLESFKNTKPLQKVKSFHFQVFSFQRDLPFWHQLRVFNFKRVKCSDFFQESICLQAFHLSGHWISISHRKDHIQGQSIIKTQRPWPSQEKEQGSKFK